MKLYVASLLPLWVGLPTITWGKYLRGGYWLSFAWLKWEAGVQWKLPKGL